MILSQKKLEEIAVAVIRDFQKSFFGSEVDDPARFALPTPIDQFASDYLNLKMSFQKLSSDGSCGAFGVSRSAAAIRLEQLGYLDRKKDYEYRDPLEVWP
ncbi:hypothetical protein [Blautia luti]|uniref:Uncharacterized protein n=1 Tax=Blautia luti TaxID=89014 RepID=A0A564W4G5_9FIRM|nr:hypothetical protein [Blautia luti]VUX39530.1 Uncharacterised protein [Blautia luti]